MTGARAWISVIRGEDLLGSTGRQIRLARMLGRTEPPAFFHHPLICNAAGVKLSKADGDTGIRELRAAGIKPAAVLGLAAHLTGLLDRPQRAPPRSTRRTIRLSDNSELRPLRCAQGDNPLTSHLSPLLAAGNSLQDPGSDPNRLGAGRRVRHNFPLQPGCQSHLRVQGERIGAPADLDRQRCALLLAETGPERRPEIGAGHREIAQRDEVIPGLNPCLLRRTPGRTPAITIPFESATVWRPSRGTFNVSVRSRMPASGRI